jgi:CRP-like cAMP-binding protein
MEAVRVEQREPLFEPGTPVRHIYFPETTVISLVSTLSNGTAVEVGTVGCEGMVGLSVFLAEDVSFVQTLTQIPGVIWRIDAEAFTRLASAPGALHGMLLRYAQAFLAQVARTAACNATHLVEERCARWLLMTHDRVESDTFPLTHELLAFMLGVRPAGVAVAMRAFQDAGMVRYSRGRVELVDRTKLEAAACDCYGVVRASFERLLPRLASTALA